MDARSGRYFFVKRNIDNNGFEYFRTALSDTFKRAVFARKRTKGYEARKRCYVGKTLLPYVY